MHNMMVQACNTFLYRIFPRKCCTISWAGRSVCGWVYLSWGSDPLFLQ